MLASGIWFIRSWSRKGKKRNIAANFNYRHLRMVLCGCYDGNIVHFAIVVDGFGWAEPSIEAFLWLWWIEHVFDRWRVSCVGMLLRMLLLLWRLIHWRIHPIEICTRFHCHTRHQNIFEHFIAGFHFFLVLVFFTLYLNLQNTNLTEFLISVVIVYRWDSFKNAICVSRAKKQKQQQHNNYTKRWN